MKYCPKCGASFSKDAAFCVQDGTRLVTEAPQVDPLIGKVIDGRYRIERQIGKGGAGSIYQAQHRLLPRKVALKFLLPGRKADPEVVARFQQELKAIAALKHPNIIVIYEVGHDKETGYYVALDHLEGEDLGSRIDDGEPLSIQEIFTITIGICDALDLIHRRGIVHRDVKAPNIFLAQDDTELVGFVPKLLDFGIAKVISFSEGLRELDMTGELRVVGTPTTMSPEQATGQKIDGRSDLYGMGVVLYEMLTRELPFTASSTREMMVMHVNDPPIPPTERLEGGWIPQELEALILSLLAKDPADRPARGKDVVQTLRRIRGRVYGAWAHQHVTPTMRSEQPALPTSGRLLRAIETSSHDAEALTPAQRSQPSPGQPRVLLVDDEQPILELLQLVLERQGYRCYTELGGEAAIDWLTHNPTPDALIVDLMMPGINGADCIQGARLLGYEGLAILFTTIETDELHEAIQRDSKIVLCDKTRDLYRLSEVLTEAGYPPSAP